MKILVASNLYPPMYIGGYELRIRDIVEGLTERGHEVYVLTSNYGVEKDHVEGRVYRCLPVFIYGYTKLPSDGVPTQFVSAVRGISTVRSLIRKHRIELVYMAKVQGFQEPVITALANSRVPVVWDISDLWLRTFGEGAWYSYWRRKPDHRYLSLPKTLMKRIVSKIVPTQPGDMGFGRACYTSHFLRDYYAQLGLPVAEAQVVHCGCPEMFYCDEEKDVPNDPFRFVYAGQFVEGKGVHTIIEAAEVLSRNRPDLKYTIDLIGDGIPEYTQQLYRLTKDSGLVDKIRILNKVPRENMPEVYRRYDGLIFSSIWEEAFALTPLEAMASGVPVISTTTGGNREIIEDGEVGLEYEAENSQYLASRMETLMTDTRLWRHLRSKGKEVVSRRFTVPHMVDAVEKYLEETLRITEKKHEYSGIAERTLVRNAAGY